MSDNGLRSQKVLVIGGSSGIGFAVAAAAQAAGASIVVASSSAERVSNAAARLGDSAAGVVVDVTSEESVASFFATVGAFDHLVYTAGDWGRTADQWDLPNAEAAFTVRFWGALRAIKHARASISANGSITITDGALAHRPRKGAAVTSAMLGALEHLTRSLAVELAPVRVNAVCPGLIQTEALAGMSEEQLQVMTKRLPLPRPGQPAEAAEAYLYLLRGTFTTGQVLHVDGGYTLV